ncbi:MAG: phasin family protein [Chromatiales bacterium]|jgi:poly(hydroxyalkanoate) granule-associated protein|nr:phasin family protein [Chromatiales bacterium]MDH4012774.1 phasin family protein [Chromatiales bacterium]
MVAKKKGRLAGAKKKTGARTAKIARPVEKTVVGMTDSAQQIWLAGLGAFTMAQKEGPKFFDKLVDEGSKVQNRTREVAGKAVNQTVREVQDVLNSGVESMRSQVTTTWDGLEHVFQVRVARALKQLGVPTSEELAALTRKVDALTRSVRELAGKKSPVAKRAVAKKAPASRVSKARASRKKAA